MKTRPGFSLIWALFLTAVCSMTMAVVGLSVAGLPMRMLHLDGKIAQTELKNRLTDAAYDAIEGNTSSDALTFPASEPQDARIFCQKGLELFGMPPTAKYRTYEAQYGSSAASVAAQSDLTEGLALDFADIPFYSESESLPDGADGVGADGAYAFVRKNFGGGLSVAKHIFGLKADFPAMEMRSVAFGKASDVRPGFAGTDYNAVFVDVALLGSGSVSLAYGGDGRYVYVLYGHAESETFIAADAPIVVTDALSGVPPTVDGRYFPVFVCPFDLAVGRSSGE